MLKELGDDAFHDFAAFFDVRHLATTEENGYLDFVFVLQKANRLFDFEVDVVLARFGTQANFLQFRLMRFAVLLSPFALLILELSIVHDSTNGWFRFRCYFNKI